MIKIESKTCPVCTTTTSRLYPGTPYWMCDFCDLWFQDPLPEKVYEGAHELATDGSPAGHLMGDDEKAANAFLAADLFRTLLKNKAGQTTLDVGSKYPYLSLCLQELGCVAHAMEGCRDAPMYGLELGVSMWNHDFEELPADKLLGLIEQRPKLITLVHCFEHLYDPKAAIAKLREIVADDGFVFLRLPDHGVVGFERDLVPSHFTIHPYFYSHDTILELLVQAKDKFVVSATSTMTGQRDIVLKAVKRAPTIVGGLIAKNEERDIPRLLNSLCGGSPGTVVSPPVIDALVLVDTGSTDKTIQVAEDICDERGVVILTSIYTAASKKNKQGEWLLENFSKARNQYVAQIERSQELRRLLGDKPDWLLWVDADDELKTPRELRRASYFQAFEVFAVEYMNGDSFIHHRMWRTGLDIKYEGAVHEYPSHGGHPDLDLRDHRPRVTFVHDATPGTGENANARNLRILQHDWQHKPSSRTAFYLAETHRHGTPPRWGEAAKYYTLRIKMGPQHRDEWLFSYLYRARCEKADGRMLDAKKTLLEAVAQEDSWSELWMELAFEAYDRKSWTEAMGYCLLSLRPIPPSTLWREKNKYTDQPRRLMSWCLEHLGDLPQALRWAEDAARHIGRPDSDWNARIERLRDLIDPKRIEQASHSQHRQDRFILEKFFKTACGRAEPGDAAYKKDGVFVDVGAYDGVTWSNTLLFERIGWTGICFEPNLNVFEKLKANRKGVLLRYGVAAKKEQKKFLALSSDKAPTDMMSGFDESFESEHRATWEKEIAELGGKVQEIQMPCVRLSDVLKEREIKHVDLLCLDTEGSELEILESLDLIRDVDIDVILVEANTQKRCDEIEKLLRTKGYTFIEKLGADLVYAHDRIYPSRGVTALTTQPHAIAKSIWEPSPRIALHRPGAIGDVIMTLQLLPLLKQKYPGHEIHYFCDSSIGIALVNIMEKAGVHTVHPHKDLQKYASCFGPIINLVGYPLAEGYPDKPMKKHLLRYFADEMGVSVPDEQPLPSLILPLPKLPRLPIETAPFITLHTKTGWSQYKNWFYDRWIQVVADLEKDINVIQIGSKDEPLVPGAISALGLPLEDSIALIAHAKLHVGLDSFSNHVTNILWRRSQQILDNGLKIGHVSKTRGVILFGSTQASASGYPENVNISLGLKCQPCFREDPKISNASRGVCDNPPGQTYEDPQHACMKQIQVEDVILAIRKALGLTKGSDKRALPLVNPNDTV